MSLIFLFLLNSSSLSMTSFLIILCSRSVVRTMTELVVISKSACGGSIPDFLRYRLRGPLLYSCVIVRATSDAWACSNWYTVVTCSVMPLGSTSSCSLSFSTMANVVGPPVTISEFVRGSATAANTSIFMFFRFLAICIITCIVICVSCACTSIALACSSGNTRKSMSTAATSNALAIVWISSRMMSGARTMIMLLALSPTIWTAGWPLRRRVENICCSFGASISASAFSRTIWNALPCSLCSSSMSLMRSMTSARMSSGPRTNTVLVLDSAVMDTRDPPPTLPLPGTVTPPREYSAVIAWATCAACAASSVTASISTLPASVSNVSTNSSMTSISSSGAITISVLVDGYDVIVTCSLVNATAPPPACICLICCWRAAMALAWSFGNVGRRRCCVLSSFKTAFRPVSISDAFACFSLKYRMFPGGRPGTSTLAIRSMMSRCVSGLATTMM